jgi:hypothetical protein
MNNLEIKKISYLISEDADTPEDGEFKECPECGTDFAIINKDGTVICVNKDCKFYNDEYVTAFKSLDTETYGDVRAAMKMGEARKKYKYEGKSGLIIMKTARERLKERQTHHSEEEKKRKGRPRHSRYYSGEQALQRAADRAYSPARYDYSTKSLAPTKTQLDTPGATIHFDDFIDQGYYYALFVKLPKPVTLTASWNRKYVGKYAKVKWRWPSPKGQWIGAHERVPYVPGEHGARGDFVLTRTHQTFAVTKRNIAKMSIDDKWVDPMDWHQQLKWPNAL